MAGALEPTNRQGALDALEAREHEYYRKRPQDTLILTPTDEPKTIYGMPVYTDQYGERHSESSVTFDIDGKWMTVPSIYPDNLTGEARYHNKDEIMEIMKMNNYINPVNGEQVQMFETQEDAVKYAVERDMSLQ